MSAHCLLTLRRLLNSWEGGEVIAIEAGAQAGRLIGEHSGIALVLKQVMDDMAVAFQSSLEKFLRKADGRPAVALVPKEVFFIDGSVFVGVKVEVSCEFVALGLGVGDGAGEGLVVSIFVFFFVGLAVAIQVPTNRIQLRQIANVNQAVVILVVVGWRHMHLLDRLAVGFWFFFHDGVGKGDGDTSGVVVGDKARAGGDGVLDACLFVGVGGVCAGGQSHGLVSLPIVWSEEQSIRIDGDSSVRRFYVDNHVSGWGGSGAHSVSGTAAFAQGHLLGFEHERGRSRAAGPRGERGDYRSHTASNIDIDRRTRRRRLIVV